MADVLPHHTNMGIAGHLFIDGFTQGVEQEGFSHRVRRRRRTEQSRQAANLSAPGGEKSPSPRPQRWPTAAPRAAGPGRAARPATPNRGESWQGFS
ncbi:hypothetical protein SynMINOS11_01419 [Synechococcus sp. Minos11]|nr:hypothetical protein SynMINOS11_01419 [Synechococcus sp. Minos11]